MVLGFNQDLEKVLKALVNQWFRWFPQRAWKLEYMALVFAAKPNQAVMDCDLMDL